MDTLLVETIISILVGLLGILLGYLIKKKELAYWVAGYNPEKHNAKLICDIVGSNIMLLGILLTFYAIIHHIVHDYFNGIELYTIIWMITTLLIVLKIQYDIKKAQPKDTDNNSNI